MWVCAGGGGEGLVWQNAGIGRAGLGARVWRCVGVGVWRGVWVRVGVPKLRLAMGTGRDVLHPGK